MTIICFLGRERERVHVCVCMSRSNASSRHPKWFIFNWSVNWIQKKERQRETFDSFGIYVYGIWHPKKECWNSFKINEIEGAFPLFSDTFPWLFQLYVIEDIYWATHYLHIHSLTHSHARTHTHTFKRNWCDGKSKINIPNHLNLEFKRMIMIAKSGQLSTFKWLD